MATAKKQSIELGISKKDGSVGRLKLRTDKGYHGGIRSNASVMWAKGGFESCVLLGEFDVTLKTEAGVATQKRIDAQFAAAFTPEVVADLIENAKAFYACDAELSA